ncbi:cytosine deaminase protein-like protein [Aulographum hederae CBS 113979]|uniref:Cytosine deaminase protein-like protein n=1 Tax=Aulographum hederae CBS 113979 TaxID=1176131 RepID=A0A6G1H8J9_9PEZI|nr:cytosine deaminase protein-like protein [Aulographum hederae CBS 113979]
MDAEGNVPNTQLNNAKVVANSSRRRTSPSPAPLEAHEHRESLDTQLQIITRAKLPNRPSSELWDVSVSDGKIASISPHEPLTPVSATRLLDAKGSLLCPSLCHAHIHLDKCFLLQDPKFADLEIVDGDFQEAMKLTTSAKSRFGREDLMRRGRQLVQESIRYGVTSMRAFVEVDGDVDFKCLDAGLALKEEFADRCEVQICAFAQLPLFSGPDGGATVRRLMVQAAEREGVDVVGSTPYVESDGVKENMNIRWLTTLALRHFKHLDFHLDYHLNESKDPTVWNVIRTLDHLHWKHRSSRVITLGHCTRLAFFSPDDWASLRDTISAANLPISFVGLPTSDLFMMRTPQNYRGTLPIPQMIKEYGINAAIAVNNVGNAFTPQGSCDPLTVASLGVGVYQAGTKQDSEILFECISGRAKSAIGLPGTGLDLQEGDLADFVIFGQEDSEWRARKCVSEVIYDPPCQARTTIRSGRVISG